MKSTIDRAGRVVIPKPLRDAIGLVPGEIEITVTGSAVRIEPVVVDRVVERNGRLFLAEVGTISADEIRDLRTRDQR